MLHYQWSSPRCSYLTCVCLCSPAASDFPVMSYTLCDLGFCLLSTRVQKGREFFTPVEECLACGKCSLTLCWMSSKYDRWYDTNVYKEGTLWTIVNHHMLLGVEPMSSSLGEAAPTLKGSNQRGLFKGFSSEVGVDVKLPPWSSSLSCPALALSAPSAPFAGNSAASILWDLKSFPHFYWSRIASCTTYCVCECRHIHV